MGGGWGSPPLFGWVSLVLYVLFLVGLVLFFFDDALSVWLLQCYPGSGGLLGPGGSGEDGVVSPPPPVRWF